MRKRVPNLPTGACILSEGDSSVLPSDVIPEYTLSPLQEYLTCFRASLFLNFSDFERGRRRMSNVFRGGGL